MASSLTIAKSQQGDFLSADLIGHIDAGADYSSVTFEGVKKLQLNFKGISLINSAGIQKWVKFMQAIPDGIEISFEQCPSNIINQCNLFANFTGGKQVKFVSFVAPYFCEKCDEGKEVLLQTAAVFSGGQVTVPEPNCPSCASKMDFDGVEDKYFQFLKR